AVEAASAAAAAAVFEAAWLAELDPPETFPPATVTGAFALTAFWPAFALAFAFWLVDACWPTFCA
ncbi:MAG: hypothetical protein ACRDMY_11175, partial [Gaiellaceae bacterium]